EGEQLTFFNRYKQSTTLQSIGLNGAGQEPTELAAFELPSDRYLKEVSGLSPTVVTTKQGYLLSYQTERPQQLFPNDSDPTLHFPIEIEVNSQGHIYYVDSHDNAIKRLIPDGTGSRIESFITIQQLVQARADIGWESLNNVSLLGEQVVATTLGAVAVLNSAGELQLTIDSYHYNGSNFVKRILFWVVVIGLALIFVYTLRFIYVDLLQRKLFMLLKQLLI